MNIAILIADRYLKKIINRKIILYEDMKCEKYS